VDPDVDVVSRKTARRRSMYQPKHRDGTSFGIWVLDDGEAQERGRSASREFRERLEVERDWALRQGMDSYAERLNVELDLMNDAPIRQVQTEAGGPRAA
jgi:hypothetical protein